MKSSDWTFHQMAIRWTGISGKWSLTKNYHWAIIQRVKLLPCSSVKDVKVGVADRGTEGLVRKVGRPPSQGCHPPLEVAGGGVPPGARVAIEGALGSDEGGLIRQRWNLVKTFWLDKQCWWVWGRHSTAVQIMDPEFHYIREYIRIVNKEWSSYIDYRNKLQQL